jgi:hypothetical protein
MIARHSVASDPYLQGAADAAWTARIDHWRGYLAIALVGSTLLAVWLLSGVPILDIAGFVAFEALYVLFPGCLLYALLSPAPAGRLVALAVGWPLGYALEIGAFALTAALHARELFTFLPLLAAVAFWPCLFYRHRRSYSWVASLRAALRGGLSVLRDQGVESLVAATAIAIAVALVGFRFFATYPLPEHVSSVLYFPDNVDYVSLAAEALHHWPITEPFVAGHPFRYYTGVFMHVAALKQVAGVPLTVTVFRLIPAGAVVVAMLQFWCLGGLLGRSRWAGPFTVALLIVIENMKLYPTHTKVFGVALFSEFAWSLTYGFGVIFLLGILILFRSQILSTGTAAAPARPTFRAAGTLVLLVILILGGSAVKTPAVATLVAGLGLFWLWRRATGKASRLLSCSLFLSLACLVAMYFLLLYGAGGAATTYTEFAPFDFLKYTVFRSTVASHPGPAVLVGVAVVMLLWKLLPVAGALWPLRRRGAWTPFVSLAVAVFAAGFIVYVLMGSPAGNESYFIWYGYIGLIPVAVASLMAVWGGIPAYARRTLLRVCAVVLAVGLTSAGATQILTAQRTLAGGRTAFWYLWYGGTLALAGGLVVLWGLRLERRLAAWTSPRGARVLAYGALQLGILGCAQALVLAVPQAWRTLLDRQAVPLNTADHPGLTAALYRGLVWVRDHTNACDVLAVNPHNARPAGATSVTVDSGYFYYSAFTERSVILESWVLTIQGQHGEQPYPALYALNSEATLRSHEKG